MSTARLSGTYTAIVTPFRDDEAQSIDWEALDRLVDAQIAGGVDGIVPCGTTGESPALSVGEQLEIVERVVGRAAGRVKVVAGTGTNATRSSIALSKQAERAGASGVMLVCPYYNKPSQAGLLRHFTAVAEAVSCSVVVYNIPGRCGVDVLPETLEELARRAKNFVSVKEATGNVLRTQTLVQRFGDRISVLSGDDALTLPIVAIGGRGVISVTSNLLPAEVVGATKAALEGRMHEARQLHLSLLPVHEAMFLEPNPAPVKAALALDGRMGDGVRGPLVQASRATREAIAAALVARKRGGTA